MSQDSHDGCREIRFSGRAALSPSAEVALEDYARAVTGARHAALLRDADVPDRVAGVHLCGPAGDLAEAAADVEAFARDMAEREETGGGLGWN